MSIPLTDTIITVLGVDGQQYQISSIDTTNHKNIVRILFGNFVTEMGGYPKKLKNIDTLISPFFIPAAKWSVYNHLDSTIVMETLLNIDNNKKAVAHIESKSKQEATVYLSMFGTLHKKSMTTSSN